MKRTDFYVTNDQNTATNSKHFQKKINFQAKKNKHNRIKIEHKHTTPTQHTIQQWNNIWAPAQPTKSIQNSRQYEQQRSESINKIDHWWDSGQKKKDEIFAKKKKIIPKSPEEENRWAVEAWLVTLALCRRRQNGRDGWEELYAASLPHCEKMRCFSNRWMYHPRSTWKDAFPLYIRHNSRDLVNLENKNRHNYLL